MLAHYVVPSAQNTQEETAMIHYLHTTDDLEPHHLRGFFRDWPNPPTPTTHLRLLRGSDAIALALTDTPERHVVGFATTITDGVLAAYIPLLEVLPEYRGRGIGRELIQRLLARLGHLYMIDVTCDSDVLPFYASIGMTPSTGASIRNHQHQAGAATEA